VRVEPDKVRGNSGEGNGIFVASRRRIESEWAQFELILLEVASSE